MPRRVRFAIGARPEELANYSHPTNAIIPTTIIMVMKLLELIDRAAPSARKPRNLPPYSSGLTDYMAHCVCCPA